MHHAQENQMKQLPHCIFTAEGQAKGTRRRKAWTEGRKDQGTGEGADWGLSNPASYRSQVRKELFQEDKSVTNTNSGHREHLQKDIRWNIQC